MDADIITMLKGAILAKSKSQKALGFGRVLFCWRKTDMKIEIMKYGDTEPTSIECESYEFRTNQVTNWIKVKHFDGSEELIKQVCVIRQNEVTKNEIL